MGEMHAQFMWGNLVGLLVFWLFVLFILYKVIYLAVKHALNDSKQLHELREEIRSLRSSGPPSGPAAGSPYGPDSGGNGERM
jgi:hypothetical protein